MPHFLGIGVSKEKLDVWLLDAQGRPPHGEDPTRSIHRSARFTMGKL